VARSIGDWYADHARDLPDDWSDDEFVERQAPWDLSSSGMSITRSARRDAGLGGRGARSSSRASTEGRGGSPRNSPSAGGSTSARTAAGSLPRSVRKRILAAVALNPRASATTIAASVTKAGSPVSPAQVAAVIATRGSANWTQKRGMTPGTVDSRLAAEIRRMAGAHPELGYKRLAALMRARGTQVSRAGVAEVLRRQWLASRGRRGTKGKPPTGSKSKRPALVIKVTAGAQTSRTMHETPLCPSCGVRLSLQGMCRCS
jgi:hypothetical protein